jgi:outer membrane protein OmpA-like peptidoglycan-associated protein
MVNGYQPHSWRHRIGRALRGLGSALVLAAVSAGLPWLLLTLAGSPVPDRIPSWDEVVAALSRRDDGTLFLSFLTYVAWGLWLLWVALVVLEAGARMRGRSAPHIPGLDGPQRVAALLITTLAAALIGTTASVGRASALPASPQGLVASTAPTHAAPAAAAGEPGGHGFTAAATGQDQSTSRLLDDAGSPDLRAAPVHQASRPQTHQIVVPFEFDSADLSAPAKDTLAQTIRDVRNDADKTRPVVIVGHTDSLGPADYNQRLSVRRARAVRDALGELAVYGIRFEVSGKGERAPIAAETRPDGSDDPAGRARNRRVDITYSLLRPSQHRTVPNAPTPSPPASSSPTPSTRSPVVELPSGAGTGLGVWSASIATIAESAALSSTAQTTAMRTRYRRPGWRILPRRCWAVTGAGGRSAAVSTASRPRSV